MTQLAVDSTGAPIQVAALSGSDSVSFSGTSAQSAAFPEGTTIVRLIPSADCFVVFGADPTADTGDHFFLALSESYVRVTPGEKLAAIQSSGTGTLYISYVA